MFRINYDGLGIATSLACAIHCAVLPLVMTSLSVFGINLIDHRGFEIFMILLAFTIGSYALWHGFRKHHHRIYPLLIFSLGIVFLCLKQVFHRHQLWFLIPAVVAIVSAHFLNLRYYRLGNHHHSATCQH